MRFFLALWVAVFHQTGPSRTLAEIVPDLPLPLFCLMRTGYLAVGVFFVLSGFILSYNYSLDERWPAVKMVRFGIARFARIYPAYLLGLLLIAPLVLAHTFSHTSGESLLHELVAAGLNGTLLQSWAPGFAQSWNSPGWSLSVEAFFYCCFPLVGVALWRLSRPRTLALAGALTWFAALAAPLAATILPIQGLGNIPATVEPYSAPFWTELIKFNPLLHLSDFCLGIIAGRAYSLARKRGNILQGRGYWLYGPGIILELIVLTFANSIPYPLLHNGLLLPVHAVVILGLAFGGGAPARFLSLGPLVFLGNASYSLYILHFPILRWIRAVSIALFSTEFTGVAITLLYVALAVGISCIVYKTIEEPANAFLKQKMSLWLAPPHSQPEEAMAMAAGSRES